MANNTWHGLPSVTSLRRYVAPMPQPSPYPQTWINAHSHLPRPPAPGCWIPPSHPLSQLDLNRIFGGIELIGATIGLAGGVVMILAPEPTLLSKPAGSLLALHSMDSMQAAMRQLYTGKRVTDFTQQGGTWAARRMGASERTANYVGVVLDVAVPLGAGIAEGTARVIAIRNGRIITFEEALQGKPGRLSLDELERVGKGKKMIKEGAHTLEKHVRVTRANVAARAARSSSGFSTAFDDESIASEALNRTFAMRRSDIRAFVLSPSTSGSREFLFDMGKRVGYGLRAGSTAEESLSWVDLVVSKSTKSGKLAFVVTCYPIR